MQNNFCPILILQFYLAKCKIENMSIGNTKKKALLRISVNSEHLKIHVFFLFTIYDRREGGGRIHSVIFHFSIKKLRFWASQKRCNFFDKMPLFFFFGNECHGAIFVFGNAAIYHPSFCHCVWFFLAIGPEKSISWPSLPPSPNFIFLCLQLA